VEHAAIGRIEDGHFTASPEAAISSTLWRMCRMILNCALSGRFSKAATAAFYYRPGQYEYQVLDNANSPYGEIRARVQVRCFSAWPPRVITSRRSANGNEGACLQGTVIQHWFERC